MPLQVTPWITDEWPTAKSLNKAAYTVNGTPSRPNGITFQATGRLFVAGYAGLGVAPASPAGTRTVLSGTVPAANSYGFYDSAGYFNATSDGTPYSGSYYHYKPAVAGGAGNGVTPGGWTVVSHMVPVQNESGTQYLIGADWGGGAGGRQATTPPSAAIGTPFAMDLVSTLGGTVTPAVWITDPSSSPGIVPSPLTPSDMSGQNPLFWTLWAGPETVFAAAYGTPAVPAPVTSWTSASTVTAALMNGNTGVTAVLNFLNSPPIWRAHQYTSQSIPDSAATQVSIGALGAGDTDPYSGWNPATGTYTIQRAGIYLLYAMTPWSDGNNGRRMTGIKVNGTVYWGAGYQASQAGGIISAKLQVFSLNAGDTIKMYCWQDTGSAHTLDNANQAMIMGVWLSAQGTPSVLWTPPDPSFRWASGTQGSDLPALFQAHLANDLGFLVNRPYLLAYQSAAQSGFADGSTQRIHMDTIAGMVHGDTGDSYSGWDAPNYRYVAPVSGWYLVTGELTATAPSLSAADNIGAALYVPSSGGHAPGFTYIWQQVMYPSLSGAAPPAPALCSVIYLAAGEFAAFYLQAAGYTSGTWGTIGHGMDSGGIVGAHCEMVWVSELT